MKAWMHGTGLALLGLVLGALVAVSRVAATDPHVQTSQKFTCDKERLYFTDDGDGPYAEYDTGRIDYGYTVKDKQYVFEAMSDEGELTLEIFRGNKLIKVVDSTLEETPDGTTNRAAWSFVEKSDDGSYSIRVRSDSRIKGTYTVSGTPPQLDP